MYDVYRTVNTRLNTVCIIVNKCSIIVIYGLDSMKVGICMFYDDEIKIYSEINYKINKKYCDKYNLQLIVSTDKKLPNRHSAWERLPLLLDNISNFDYLIWVDADAFFYYDANNILDIISDNKDVHFIFSKDVNSDNVNTGIMIVKNSQYSIEFLNKWLYDEKLYNNNPRPLWWDQGVLIGMMNNNILNIIENCAKLNYGDLQHFYNYDRLPNTYIFHLAGRDETVRITESTKYFDKITTDT